MDRAERRRQLKEDERSLARGLDPERADGPQIMVLMRILHDRIEASRRQHSIAPLMDFFQRNMASASRAAPRHALACRLGCAHCCHAWVSARAPEVFLAKAAIPRKEREEVRAVVEQAHAATGALSLDERIALAAPCPMLRDNQCRIYEARPSSCRGAVSLDVSACARAFQPGAAAGDIPMPDFYIVLKRGYSIALAGALKRAGLPAVSYEFTSALRAALARPDAEAAWLAGEDVFAGVQVDPGSDPFEHPKNRQVYEAAFA